MAGTSEQWASFCAFFGGEEERLREGVEIRGPHCRSGHPEVPGRGSHAAGQQQVSGNGGWVMLGALLQRDPRVPEPWQGGVGVEYVKNINITVLRA